MGWQLIESKPCSYLDSETQGEIGSGYKLVWYGTENGAWWTALFKYTREELQYRLEVEYPKPGKLYNEHYTTDFFSIKKKTTTGFPRIVEQKQRAYEYDFGSSITLAVSHLAKQFTLEELIAHNPQLNEAI
ncbi:hypothetical protein [Actinopolyspora erythraea]|uniref:hypothetical protein n=1 Tax=Actinopolyspora erythraea TaxID=414996 RepID=UPI001185EAD8|nr:hypothetical protein [Actinopolyspora erythraea]